MILGRELKILNENRDATKIMAVISKERKETVEVKDPPELEQARYDYDEAVAELARLDTIYANKLQMASASQVAYARILSEFEEEHPDLSEEEFADAFDEYWQSCPEYFPEDYLEVEAEYCIERARQKKQVDFCKRSLEDLEDKTADLKNAMKNANANEVTLEDVLKEYAVVFLVREGHMVYPSTSIEKNVLLSRISTEMAAKIFLANEADKVSLTAEERTYLEN